MAGHVPTEVAEIRWVFYREKYILFREKYVNQRRKYIYFSKKYINQRRKLGFYSSICIFLPKIYVFLSLLQLRRAFLNPHPMQISQVAAQLYTVRDFCGTPNDIARTLERVRAIGYEAVQTSGLGPIENADLLRLAQQNGLTICATHESIGDILDQPERVIDKLRALDCHHTAIGFPSGVDLGSKEGVLDFCRRFESAAQKFVEAGMTVSHHNHHHEFRRIEGRPVLGWILDQTRAVSLELDTYWVQYGGGSPVEWNRRAEGRLPLLHLKDYAINDQNIPQFAEIGQGNLDFPAIISSAEESGCAWFIVEQDTCPGDPFDSLRISFEFLRDNLASS